MMIDQRLLATPVFYFVSVLYRCDLVSVSPIIDELRTWLTLEQDAPFDSHSAPIPLPHLVSSNNPQLHYYAKEMLPADRANHQLLQRELHLLSSRPVARHQLVALKERTLELERQYAQSPGNARAINLDPGFLALDQIILATTKPFYHRVALSDSLYADLLLYYQQKEWRPFPWTYPDYQCQQKLHWFLQLRQQLHFLLR